jgi:hypothetical protein
MAAVSFHGLKHAVVSRLKEFWPQGMTFSEEECAS